MQLIENASYNKLRGAYYTPKDIASFILKWGINGNAENAILEPSCGDGIFLQQIKNEKLSYKSMTAIEIDSAEAKQAEKIKLRNAKIVIEDFYIYCNDSKDKFDLIIGNPPYIRYQYLSKKQHDAAKKIYSKADLEYTKLSNSWVSFVVGSSLMLKEKGKLGFVIPAELLQVSYAKNLREYLSAFFNKINIISFKKLVFPSIQQEVLLLLCEKNGKKYHSIEHIELNDASDLARLNVARLKTKGKKIDNINSKWTYYFLDQKEIDFLEDTLKNRNIPTICDYSDVEVGITTGANNYFTVPCSIVDKYDLKEYAKPMVGRSIQVPSAIFTKEDWKNNLKLMTKANLLIFPGREQLKNHLGAITYIKLGESLGINKGYKTSIREDWFVIPSIKLSDAFFIRRNNLFPRLILNTADAYTTDTMHRVFLHKNVNKNAFIASYYNSLSLAFSEIVGRSYGGGVLELMPSEAGKILLPYHNGNADLVNEIDDMLREKVDIDQILKKTDKLLLSEKFGFSTAEIKIANGIWNKLSFRRLNRKQR